MARGIAEAQDLAGLIASLEAANRRIEKIVDGIGLVAVQTNMLAVSGAVEAARAGDFGRGFALVSADIRALARDAGDNADRVKDVVRQLQDQIATVRRDLEQSGTAAQSEIGRSRAMVDRLSGVQSEIGGLSGISDRILAWSDDILVAVRQVLSGARQIASAADETAGAAAQAATAARQQTRGAEDLAAAVEEIASLADELQLAED